MFSPAAYIAPHARAVLTSGDSLRVVQVFDAGCNLMTDSGEVMSILAPPLRPDPLAIVLRDRVHIPHDVSIGDGALLADNVLTIGRLMVDLSPAVEWNPRPDWDRIAASPPPTHFMRRHPLSNNGEGEKPTDQVGQGVRRHQDSLQSLTDELCAAIHQARWDDAQQAAAQLIGLGPGMTPSGDDALVGIMLAWYLLDHRGTAQHALSIIEPYLSRTNRLSAAWLRSAARGEASANWQDFIAAVSTGNHAMIDAPMKRILATGHTSGADALTGFMTMLNHYIGRIP